MIFPAAPTENTQAALSARQVWPRALPSLRFAAGWMNDPDSLPLTVPSKLAEVNDDGFIYSAAPLSGRLTYAIV